MSTFIVCDDLGDNCSSVSAEVFLDNIHRSSGSVLSLDSDQLLVLDGLANFFVVSDQFDPTQSFMTGFMWPVGIYLVTFLYQSVVSFISSRPH